MIDFAFFGCRGGAGHFMTAPDGSSINDCDREGIPTPEDLDASRLFLPYPEKVGEGRITYLPALNVTVMSWWNRVIDERSCVNSHILCRGEVSIGTMWNVFTYRFPDVAKLHQKPIIARTY